jgi:hypothetical protein
MKREIFVGLLIFFLTLVAYLFVAGDFQWQYRPTQFAYFNLLTESFLDLRLDLVSPPANRFDLSEYQGRVYLYWGPLPAILILPLIAFYGPGLSDKLYTAFFGALNVFIFYFVLLELRKLVKGKIRFNDVVLLSLFFAFGTVSFAVSVVGRVWFTSQALSLTISLASLFFLIGFLRKKKGWFWAVFFWVISWFGRLSYFLTFPLYLGAIWLSGLPQKKKVSYLLTLLLLIVLGLSIYAFYNQSRFGSIWETGQSFQTEAGRFKILKEKWGVYSFRYLPANLWYQFIKPILFQAKFPFIKPDGMGNGILFTSPLFLLLVYALKTPFKKLKILFLAGALPAILNLLFFYGTGYFQFGARYLLDVIPLLILVLALSLKNISPRIVSFLLILSIIFCSLGAVWFAAQAV